MDEYKVDYKNDLVPVCPNCHAMLHKKKGLNYLSINELKEIIERKSASKRGYDSRWTKARKRFLKANPLCVGCLKSDRVVEVTGVVHIIPYRGDKKLFRNESNW